uniref:Uncharacterized protein n=1 Tax=Parascaris univalens TaxID=6257 RepID=A0A915BWQ6_PARUN
SPYRTVVFHSSFYTHFSVRRHTRSAMDNNRTQECPNATTDDAVNFACPPSLVDSGADCNPASAAEHTINRQLYDALNGILDNLIGKESRWTISLHVPIRQYHHYRGPRSDTMSPTRRVRFHSIKHVRGALGKRNFRNCDYEEECSLMPKRKHWLEDKQAESLSINERLSVSKTTAPTSSRKPTYVPQDGSMPLFTPFETTIMQPVIPPISKEAHTDKCHTTITAAEKNFVENFVECCFNAVMTHLRQVCSTAEHAITQRISDAEINSCEEEQLCGEYNATRDIMLVNEPQLNDTHELSAKMGGEQQLSEAYNSSAGAEIGYFCEETDLVSSKGIEISLEFEDRSQQLETKSRLLAGFTNDASIVADSSIFERVALAGCTRARDILLPSLRIFETTITVSVDACQNILLSPQKTDIDIVQLHRRNEVVTIDRNIEDKSHLSSFKRGYQQETPIIASDVDADSGAKDSCKENFEVLEKRSVPQSHVDLLQNSDGSDFSATEKDTAPRRLSVLERVALKEQQMKQLMSPQMLILDDVKHRKRAASLIARNSLNYQNTEGAQTSTIVFHGISVRERVMLKERELKEIESLPVSKFSSKFLHGSHHATRRSISDPKECRREKHDVTAGYIAHTSSLHRKSELMSTPVLPTNNSKMKGTLSDENSITSRNLRLDSEIVHEAALRLTNHSSFINQHVQNAALQRDAPENIRRERKQYPSTQAPIEGNCAEDNEQETRTEQVNVHEDGNVDLTQGNVISSQCRVSEGSLSRDFLQQNSWPTDWSHRFHKIRLIFENGYLEGRKYLDDLRISDEKKKFLDFDNDPESQKVCQKANGDIIASNDTVEPEAIHSSKERSQNCESDEVSDVDINVATNDRQIPAPKAAAKLSLREAESPSTSDQDLSSDKHIGGDRNQGAGNEHETNRAVAKEVEFYRCSVKHLIRLKEDQIMRMEEADEQECPPSRLKTLCEEYGPIKDHLSEVGCK